MSIRQPPQTASSALITPGGYLLSQFRCNSSGNHKKPSVHLCTAVKIPGVIVRRAGPVQAAARRRALSRSLHGKYTHPCIGTQEKFKDSLRDLRLRLPAGAASRVLTLLAAQAKQFSHTVLVQLFFRDSPAGWHWQSDRECWLSTSPPCARPHDILIGFTPELSGSSECSKVSLPGRIQLSPSTAGLAFRFPASRSFASLSRDSRKRTLHFFLPVFSGIRSAALTFFVFTRSASIPNLSHCSGCRSAASDYCPTHSGCNCRWSYKKLPKALPPVFYSCSSHPKPAPARGSTACSYPRKSSAPCLRFYCLKHRLIKRQRAVFLLRDSDLF